MLKSKYGRFSDTEIEQRFEVAKHDYASLCVFALKDLSRTGYILSELEQQIADGLSVDFKLIRKTTWQAMPLDTRQELQRARTLREGIREHMRLFRN